MHGVDAVEEDDEGSDEDVEEVDPGAQFNGTFWLDLKSHLSFGLRFPTLRKCSKMGSSD